jgi:hypothetical protein
MDSNGGARLPPLNPQIMRMQMSCIQLNTKNGGKADGVPKNDTSCKGA